MGIELVQACAQAARQEAELAACAQDDEPLAGQGRRDRPVAASEIEGEGAADPDHLVEPGLQGAGHAVVVHRHPDHDKVGRLDLQAAIAGQGVALLSLALVAVELASGALIQPFGPSLERLRYDLVYPSGAKMRPPVEVLRDWLMTELAPCLAAEGARRG